MKASLRRTLEQTLEIPTAQQMLMHVEAGFVMGQCLSQLYVAYRYICASLSKL